jgi:hypothetical protein
MASNRSRLDRGVFEHRDVIDRPRSSAGFAGAILS